MLLSSDTIEHTQKLQKATKKLNKQTGKLIKKFSQISQLYASNENTVSCDYYDLNDFNKVIVTKQDLAVLHLNISSLSSHINELKLLLFNFNLNFDIICITESRITKSNPPTGNIHIPGYYIEQTLTESSAGGTLIIYLKNFLTKAGLTSKYITLNIWNLPSLKSSFHISSTL